MLFVTQGITGLGGAIAGLLLFTWLHRSGQPMVVGSPMLAFIAISDFPVPSGCCGAD